jgi:endoglucanase
MYCQGKRKGRLFIILLIFILIGSTSLFGQMRDITAHEIVADMKVGWNLGNNFDSLGGDETAWGNPTPTKGLFDALRDMGFKTIRIPVSW